MTARPRIVRTVKALRASIAALRSGKRTIALVPTMGALHDGHIALVRFARARADRVVASVFVNPAQFGPAEDFGRYPRTWKADIKALAGEKTDLVFAPEVKTIYPDGVRDQNHAGRPGARRPRRQIPPALLFGGCDGGGETSDRGRCPISRSSARRTTSNCW